MKIGFVLESARCPAPPQVDALKAWGAKKLFVDGQQSLGDFLACLRAGDIPGVTAIHRLGLNFTEMSDSLASMQAKGLRPWLVEEGRFAEIADAAKARNWYAGAVSYTHLTLPTNREV